MVEHLEGLGRLGVVIDGLGPRERANSEAEGLFWWHVEELGPLADALAGSLDDLMVRSAALGVPMRATLFSGR